jgi:hypothetical protein
MVQAAAERADGLQWRRALAGVAVDELNISLGEAIHHPAVLRATVLLGVPGYAGDPAREPAGAADVASDRPASSPSPPAVPANGAPDTDVGEPTGDPTAEAPAGATALPDVVSESPAEPPTATPDPPTATPDPPAAPAEPPLTAAIRVGAVHLAGIETLREGARNIELRFSDIGLDVLNTHDGESIGRLGWDEITELELPRPRRSLRRRKPAGPELVVRTDRGQARFELPSLSEDEAEKHLAPVLRRARGDESSG